MTDGEIFWLATFPVNEQENGRAAWLSMTPSEKERFAQEARRAKERSQTFWQMVDFFS